MAKDHRPQPATTVDVDACKDNAWLLLMRAKKALFARGWPAADVGVWAMRAGQEQIAKHHSDNVPPPVYCKLLAAVSRVDLLPPPVPEVIEV